MTHSSSNPAGLQVRDLIAELQRHHPGDFTDVSVVKRRVVPPSVVLIDNRAEQRDALAGEIDRLRSQAHKARSELEEAQYAHKKLIERAGSARALLARLKRQLRSKPIRLP